MVQSGADPAWGQVGLEPPYPHWSPPEPPLQFLAMNEEEEEEKVKKEEGRRWETQPPLYFNSRSAPD